MEARAAARPSGEDACAASAQGHNRSSAVRRWAHKYSAVSQQSGGSAFTALVAAVTGTDLPGTDFPRPTRCRRRAALDAWAASCPMPTCPRRTCPRRTCLPSARQRPTRGLRLQCCCRRYRVTRYRAAAARRGTGRLWAGHSPRVERCAPTAAGRSREVGIGQVRGGHDADHASSAGAPTAAGQSREVGIGQVGVRHGRYQGTECRTVRLLRHRAVFMRPSPDGAGAIMSLCARRAGVLAGRACRRTGLLAGEAARASLARGRTHPPGTRYGPGVLRTRGTTSA
ncbi:MAG: hypothetical protein ACJAZN_000821 [Planctomycetota bacterium]